MGHAAVEGISTAMGAIFILSAVGALVGTWMMSGTVATLVHLGIQWLNPDWYYLACVIICALLALSIGSSWTVVGTSGVGLIGIANVLGVSPEITAGAVISGSCFGDKMSPLSETTNLTPAWWANLNSTSGSILYNFYWPCSKRTYTVWPRSCTA